ncbi:DUF945 family protein [Modicisalibacter coralii]|uniref:DUF945 family protein n=1 Tax=Modicisalibacter coralii TaxID=2304602 RepID=UPI00100A7B20|nr:DUF945 family protein [Halomonas coralii]
MRKRWLAVAAVAVLGVGGYLAALAYSSTLFERELALGLARVEAQGDWRIVRDDVERGWFHSRGQIAVSADAGESPWTLSIPYRASHGVLHTRLHGSLQVLQSVPGSAEMRTLFGDRLTAARPRWTATVGHLDRRGEVRLDVPAFELTGDAGRFAFTGAELDLEGRIDDLRLTGQVSPVRWQRDATELSVGPLYINNRYRLVDRRRIYHQRNELILDRLEYRSPARAPLTLSNLRYADETRLDDQLRLAVSLSLAKAALAGQPLLSGHLDLHLERIDGGAVRRLVAAAGASLQRLGGDPAALDDRQRRRLLAELEPRILALLADSPHLVLEGASLDSDLLGMSTRGHGELTFDGRDSRRLSLDALADPARRETWRRRLDGRFVWFDVPTLVAMQLGLPVSKDRVVLTVESGRLRLDGRPLSADLL